MGVREIEESINNESNIDAKLKNDILEKISNINKANTIISKVEEQLLINKDKFMENEYEYISQKFNSYKLIFEKFASGSVIDYEHIVHITERIFNLEEGIKNNNLNVWKEEFISLKGSKKDKDEDSAIRNMLAIIPEKNSSIENILNFFHTLKWKIKNR